MSRRFCLWQHQVVSNIVAPWKFPSTDKKDIRTIVPIFKLHFYWSSNCNCETPNILNWLVNQISNSSLVLMEISFLWHIDWLKAFLISLSFCHFRCSYRGSCWILCLIDFFLLEIYLLTNRPLDDWKNRFRFPSSICSLPFAQNLIQLLYTI